MLKNCLYLLQNIGVSLFVWIVIAWMDWNVWPISWKSPSCIHMAWLVIQFISETNRSSSLLNIHRCFVIILSIFYDIFYGYFLGQKLIELGILSILASISQKLDSFTFFWIQSSIIIFIMKFLFFIIDVPERLNLAPILTLLLLIPWITSIFQNIFVFINHEKNK
jgi:hypothetical protein